MYVAPAFGGFGLIVAPSADERLAAHTQLGVRIDSGPASGRAAGGGQISRASAAGPSTRSPLLRPRPAGAPAEVVSSLGTQMTFLALPWFVLSTTGSTTKMTLVLAAELAPVALLGIPSGAVLARLGAIRTMLVCDLVRVPLMVAIPVLHAAGALTFPLLSARRARARLLRRPVLLGTEGGHPGTARRRPRSGRAGERRPRGRHPADDPARTGAGGRADRLDRRASVLYVDAATFAVSFVLLALLVPRRAPLQQTGASRGVLAGLASSSPIACWHRSSSPVLSSTSSVRRPWPR